MTTSAAGQPLVPQPPATVAALRQTIRQIAPAALPAFTRELDQAADQSRQGSDRWEDAAESGDAAQARRAAGEIGRILDAAHAAICLPVR
jgi:hypothetical protein